MFTFSKLAQAGIAAVSYLVESGNDGGDRPAGSAEIADARGLSRALVAKVLTLLSAAGLVKGRPGPAGGYWLALPASGISLLDIVRVFEDPGRMVMCPFGPRWCGTGPKCPLHDTFVSIQDEVQTRLEGETFEQFASSAVDRLSTITSAAGIHSPGCSTGHGAGRPSEQ